MSAPEFDLAVIGAGPAGAACALAAARSRLRVVLVDPLARAFDKPCGEGILPSGVAALAELGLASVIGEAFPFHALRFVLPGRRPLDVELGAAACALPRPHLMRALDRALEPFANVSRVRAHADASPCARGFEIRARAPHRRDETIATARVLVAADGIGGGSAPWLRAAHRRRSSGRFGIRARFALVRSLDRVEIHMGARADVYLTPLSSDMVNVAVLFDEKPDGVRGADELCQWALARHPAARSYLGDVATAPESRALGAAGTLFATGAMGAAHADAYAIGDAAGAVDPILGCGVSLALESAIAAARAAEARTKGTSAERAARWYRAEWRRISAARRRLARGLCFLSAHPRLAGACVEIARASPLVRRRLCRWASGHTLCGASPEVERRAPACAPDIA